MSTQVGSESFNPLSMFFEMENEEGETRGRRGRAVRGPGSSVGRRFNVANRNRAFLKSGGRRRSRPSPPFPPLRPGSKRKPRRKPYENPMRWGSAAGLPENRQVPEGSEFIRWVQSSLNRILSLSLPIDGVMD